MAGRPTLERPVFRPSLVPGAVAPDQVFLLAETRQYVLIGKAYHALAPLLDGTRSEAEAVEAAAGAVDLPEVLFAFDQLVRKGYVVEGAVRSADEGTEAWWDTLGVHGRAGADRLARTPVSLTALGGVDASGVSLALEGAGLDVVPGADDDRAAIGVVVTDDYLRPELSDLDARQRAAGSPWLLARPFGQVVWLGPIFVPGRTACWRCLAERLHGNRQVERYVARERGRSEPLAPPRVLAPAPLGAAAWALATLVEQWAVTGAPPEPLVGRIRTEDMETGEVALHAVAHRPQCPACGRPEPRDPERPPPPLVLGSSPKRSSSGGGHRAVPPEETWRRLERHVSPLTGVVSSLVRKEPPDNARAFSYAAGHDFPHHGHDLDALRGNLRFRSGGKGATDLQARVSAVCEAVERWAGVWRGDEPSVRGSARELAGRVVPLEDILHFSDAQLEGRHAWNRSSSPPHFHVVPEPLDPERTLDWVPATSLASGEERLLLASWAYHGHPEAGHFYCASDANGTSAGNTLEEAVLQGFLELVERDAVAIWWYNRLRRPALDLASFRDPWVDDARRYHEDLGRELWVLDLTHDLGIPVFAGVSRRSDGPPEDLITSFGAHLDPRVALTRAISEVNQFLPAVSRRNPDGTTRYAYDDPDALAWWSKATVASEPWLLPDDRPPVPAGAFDGLPRNDDLRDDVEDCLARAGRAGLDTLVVRQTRPDVELEVVRVVVPGLRHFWRRLGPGRLYDVPVALGWLEEALPESGLNPSSMFF